MAADNATTYTRGWCGTGEITFLTLSSGTRLRYLKVGTGPLLLLLHTLRTQLDYFQRLIPKLTSHFTVYAIDLPGLGWSEISPGASYEEPAVRTAVVEFVEKLDLTKVDEVGFTDLAPGSASSHGAAARSNVDWIEVYGKAVPRTAGQTNGSRN